MKDLVWWFQEARTRQWKTKDKTEKHIEQFMLEVFSYFKYFSLASFKKAQRLIHIYLDSMPLINKDTNFPKWLYNL